MYMCTMDYRVILCVCLVALVKQVSPLSFVITPYTGGVVGHVETVKLRCSETTLPEGDRIYHFAIAKWDGFSWNRVVMLDDTHTEWTDVGLQNRARITGDVDFNRYIELEFTTLQCIDRGSYQCSTFNELESKEATAELLVNSVPSSVYLTSNPVIDSNGIIEVNPLERVVLTCQAQVGSPRGTILWYMRHSTAEVFSPYYTNVTDGNVIPDDANCQNQQTSDMVLYPPQTWPQFIFICNVSNSVNSEPLSHTVTVGVRGVNDSGAEEMKISTIFGLAALIINGIFVFLTSV